MMMLSRTALLAALLAHVHDNPVLAFTATTLPRFTSRGVSSLQATLPSESQQASEPSNAKEESSSSSSSTQPDMKAYAAGYKTVFDEVSCRTCKPVMGEIPADLIGSYYKSGPAMFSAGSLYPPQTALVKPKQRPVPDNVIPERMVMHPFEGDGGILGVTFSGDGKAVVRFRYVRTVGLFKECKVGRKRYTGMEATRATADCAGGLGNFDWQLPLFRHHLFPGLNKLRKNTSNTRPIYWGKRLMSLWEGGLPFKMDAVSLQTEGKSLLGGAIKKEDRPFGSKMVFDSVKNRALFYGIEQGTKLSEITIYEFDDKFRLVNDEAGRYSVDVPGCAILNDMAATEDYAIFVQPPLEASLQFVVNRDPGKSLKLGDGPSTLHLIPRMDSKKAQAAISIPMDEYLTDGNLLFSNSYEDVEKGVLIIDAVRPETAPPGKSVPPYPWVDTLNNYRAGAGKKGLWRYTVDLKSQKVSKERLVSDDVSFAVINPAVSTQRHRYVYYTLGALSQEASPPQGIGRYDAETGKTVSWMPEAHQFCGEPQYAAKTGGEGKTTDEDDGYILSLLFDGKSEQSELIVLSAREIENGPIARVPLGFAVPHGAFGVFTDDPEAAWPEDTISRRAKLADKIESRGSLWNEVKSDFAGLG